MQSFLAFLDINVIQQKLNDNLLVGRVISTTLTTPFISSLLYPVPKFNGELRQIYHLSFLYGYSVNKYIFNEVANLKYTTLVNNVI